MERNLDGFYFRVEREGKWKSICFSDLTEEEMRKVTEGKSIEWLQQLAIGLGRTIKEIGDTFNMSRETEETNA